MDVRQPVVVAIPLDDSTLEVVEAAVVFARLLETALVPVHALPPWPFPTARRTVEEADAARYELRTWLATPARKGVAIAEPIIEESNPAPLVLDVALRTHAQMIVVGGSHGTLTEWALGTVADRVVRAAHAPVVAVRGTLPGPTAKILCPFDLSPHARLGLIEAVRMARLFHAPLTVLTVVPKARGAHSVTERASLAEIEGASLEGDVRAALAAIDTTGVSVTIDMRPGNAAAVILDAASDAGMIVLASRAFDHVVPAAIGDVTERVLHKSHCTVLAIRDRDTDPKRRTDALERVAALRTEAKAVAAHHDLVRAESLLRLASAAMPGNAMLVDDLADVVQAAGRAEEAERLHALARLLRGEHT